MKNPNIFCFIVFICFTSSALCQNVFTGKIKDNQNKEIFSAIIIVLDNNQNEISYSISDTLGNFAINIPDKKDNFKLYISCFGYKPLFTEFTTTKEFVLEPDTIDLTGVEITATRPMVIREVDKFIISSIHTSQLAQGKNIVDFLKYAPLLNITRDNEIEIIGKSKATIIYINGRKSSVELSSIPAENIEKVEIITHPGSQYANNERDGVVNIVLRKPPEDGVLVNAVINDKQKEQLKLNNPSFSLFLDAKKRNISITTGISAYYLPFTMEDNGVYHYYPDSLDVYTKISKNASYFSLNGFLNMDYHINKYNTIGFRIETSTKYNKDITATEIRYNRLNLDITDSLDITQSELKMEKPNYTLHGNFNYNVTLNAKSKLSFDLDYNRYQSTAPIYFQYNKYKILEYKDFLTISKTLINGYSFKTDYKHKFNNDMNLGAGGSVYGAIVDNPYFYGNKINDNYVGDTLHTTFKDITAAIYVNFDWNISDKWSLLAGLRGEYYAYKVLSLSQHTNIFPSLSIYYTPNENHELSFDFSSTSYYHGYSLLNPFKIYYSPTLYKENNTYLKPFTDYDFGLTYILMSDYSWGFNYTFTKNSFSEFTIPIGNGASKIINKNYGKDHNFDVFFSFSKQLFKQFTYIALNLDLSYFIVDDVPDSIVVFNNTGLKFIIDLKWNNALNRKKDWRLDTRVQYSPKSSGVAFSLNSTCYWAIYASKHFINSTLSFGVDDIIYKPLQIFLNNSVYGYYRIRNTFSRTYFISYSIRFGNNKINRTNDRENKMNSRLG